MDLLAGWLVGRPVAIASVAMLLLAAYLWIRRQRGPRRRMRGLLAATTGWGLYAVWEALVQWRTPEADIRVDLLLIWPLLALLSVWATADVLLAMRRR